MAVWKPASALRSLLPLLFVATEPKFRQLELSICGP